MGFSTLFSSGPFPRTISRPSNLQHAGHLQHEHSIMTMKSSTSTRMLLSVRKFLHIHRSGVDESRSARVPASLISQPTQVYQFESPTVANQVESESAPSSSLTSPPTTADSGPSPSSSTDTSPATLGSLAEVVKADSTPEVSPETEYNIAIEDLRNAEKILAQRHTAIKTQSKPRPARRKSKSSPQVAIKKELPVKTAGSRKAALPSHLRASSDRRYQHNGTAQEACDALQRRQLIRELAYHATNGCGDAISAFEELNAHYALKARRQDDTEIPDLILNFDGIHVPTSKLRFVERNWILRHNATRQLYSLADRKQLGTEDCQLVVEQLFPAKARDILDPEHFTIFVTGLALEGIITTSEANSLSRLHISVEEFEAGARWNTTSHERHNTQHGHGHNLSTLSMFDIPTDGCRTVATFPAAPRADLHHYLRILIEAAVYDRKFWKGFFFPNARSKLQSFYDAYQIGQQGLLTPPALTPYKRTWTHRETRLLQRGQLIVTLLQSFEAGTLIDFGLLRAIRGTFIPIPAQGYWDPEDLATFLYHRVVDSGLPLHSIPQIIALHPEHDTAFSNARLAARITAALEEQAETFRQEEEVRRREMEVSKSSFEEVEMRGLTRWGRCKMRMRKRFGFRKGEVVGVFDPFAEY
jgi:hypothetical protein